MRTPMERQSAENRMTLTIHQNLSCKDNPKPKDANEIYLKLSSKLNLLSTVFQVSIQPRKKLPLPDNGVLWFQYPVIFFGEQYQL
jgi:hypothetical protein